MTFALAAELSSWLRDGVAIHAASENNRWFRHWWQWLLHRRSNADL